MSIDPKVAIWINVVLALANAITSGTLSFAGIVSPATAVQISSAAMVIQLVLSTVMHGYSSPQPGPFAAPPAGPPQANTPAQK